jgi:CubicO group peptidase (beta-lactamase class C family)
VVTIKDLLSNDSGRHYDFATDYTSMAVEARDKTAASVALGQDAPPGTIWAYNNSAIQTLSRVLEVATGMSPSDYAEQKLFAPIGMEHSTMRKDASGHTMTFMGLASTCLDMARFGYLILREGNWGGTQVVPQAWVKEATNTSQELNDAYGYLWWLNRSGHLVNPLQPTTGQEGTEQPDRQMVPGAPETMFWALGLGNQIIAIDPGTDTVVVRLGGPRAPVGAAAFTQADAAEVATQAIVGP